MTLKTLLVILVFARSLDAQTLPVTKTLQWDANPPFENVVKYIVTLDGVTIGTPAGTSQPVTFTTVGDHTLTVAAENATGARSYATALVYNIAVPTPPPPPPPPPAVVYQLITVGSAAIGLPAALLTSTTTACSFQAETASIRWRHDGGPLSSSVGIALPVGHERVIAGLPTLQALRLIRATNSTAKVHVWCR